MNKHEIDVMKCVNIKSLQESIVSERTSRKIPNKIFKLTKINLTTLNRINYHLKKHVLYVNKLSINLENSNCHSKKMEYILKKSKSISLLEFFPPSRIPDYLDNVFWRLVPKMYRTTKGLNSPLILRQCSRVRNEKIKSLKKFKNMELLIANTSNITETLENSYTQLEMNNIERALKQMKYLKCLKLVEQFQHMYPRFLKIMRDQLSDKLRLKNLTLFVFSSESKNDMFNSILKKIGDLESLENINICTDGYEFRNKNIKQLSTSLKKLPLLKKTNLSIVQPLVTKQYLLLNDLKNLTLELIIRLASYDYAKTNLLKKLQVDLDVRIEDIENKRLADCKLAKGLFSSWKNLPKLNGFTYSEEPDQLLSFNSRHNLIMNFCHMIRAKSINLKKLSLTFSSSTLVEFCLTALSQGIETLKFLEEFNFNIFEYQKSEMLEKSLTDFLNVLKSIPSLKDLYFSIDGDTDPNFSLTYLDLMTKCRHIKSLGCFSLKIGPQDVKNLLRKISKIKSLESVVAWILPPGEENFDEYFRNNQTEINQSIVDSLNSLPGLQKVCFRLPISTHMGRSMQYLAETLKKKDINFEINSLPLDLE